MSQSGNAPQAEYWNGPVGQRWAARSGDIDRGLARISAALMAFAAPKAGERVLDIGCGAGATALELARAVSPGGTVAGIDLSAPMLATARRRAKDEGAAIEFIEADASVHPFTPRYDLLFSRYGVMFFADPAAAFANLRHALKPNGRLAFVTWRTFPENAWTYAPYKAVEHLLPPEGPSDPHAPGPFAFADPKRVVDILSRAGFSNVVTERLDTTMHMGATAEHAAKEALVIGPLARAATGLPDDVRDRILKIVENRMKEFATADGITPPAACWLVGARA